MLHDNDDPDARLRALEGLPPNELKSAIEDAIQRIKAQQVGLDCIVGGAIFDFAAFLSSREDTAQCSYCGRIAELSAEFLRLRGLNVSKELRVQDWPNFIPGGK